MLELIEIIEQRDRHINDSKFIIGFDNRLAYREIVIQVKKITSCASDIGVEIV